MEATNYNNPLHKRQGKDKQLKAQLRRVLSVLSNKPKTMRMVEVETGIKVKSICWRVYDLRKDDRIKIAFKDVCPISKRRNVNFYTANKNYFPDVEPSKF